MPNTTQSLSLAGSSEGADGESRVVVSRSRARPRGMALSFAEAKGLKKTARAVVLTDSSAVVVLVEGVVEEAAVEVEGAFVVVGVGFFVVVAGFLVLPCWAGRWVVAFPCFFVVICDLLVVGAGFLVVMGRAEEVEVVVGRTIWSRVEGLLDGVVEVELEVVLEVVLDGVVDVVLDVVVEVVLAVETEVVLEAVSEVVLGEEVNGVAEDVSGLRS